MDDLKFLFLACLVPLAFFAFVSKGEWIKDNPNWEPQWETPTVTFVPAGTPGAITLEEYNERRYGWRRP